MRAELKVDLKLPGRNAIPTCETLSRVQVSQGPDGKGGCWEGLKLAVSVKRDPGREETKRGERMLPGSRCERNGAAKEKAFRVQWRARDFPHPQLQVVKW